MTIEQRPVVAGQQPELKKVWEPTTFAERTDFIRQVNRRYLNGEISWEELWYYEQTYGLGAPGEKTS